MDIYEYLKQDHSLVDNLFKQFEKSDCSERKKQIVQMICEELICHAISEQETFYKTLQRYPSIKDRISHGKEEHLDIEEQIREIQEGAGTEVTWLKKINKLQEIVKHHVKEEEGEIFKLAKKTLSTEEANDIKEKMHYLKPSILKQYLRSFKL